MARILRRYVSRLRSRVRRASASRCAGESRASWRARDSCTRRLAAERSLGDIAAIGRRTRRPVASSIVCEPRAVLCVFSMCGEFSMCVCNRAPRFRFIVLFVWAHFDFDTLSDSITHGLLSIADDVATVSCVLVIVYDDFVYRIVCVCDV